MLNFGLECSSLLMNLHLIIPWLKTPMLNRLTTFYEVYSIYVTQAHSQGGGGVQGVQCTPPNLPKSPLLAAKWAKN